MGIGDIGISSGRDGEVKTYALGSCVAVIVYDKIRKRAAMAHVTLPDSTVNPKKTNQNTRIFCRHRNSGPAKKDEN